MLTQKQILDRVNFIGGSDVAVIFGLSQYKTPYQLYLEKIGAVEPSFIPNEYMLWGSLIEPVIRSEFARRNNCVVTQPEQLTHPKYDFIRGNFDGFLPAENAILEIKCCSGFAAKDWGTPGTDEIPVAYMLQVATYCAIANVDYARIAVLVGGNDYREYRYDRDLDIEQGIINKCVDFWHCVTQRIPPAATTIDDLRLKFPVAAPEKAVCLDDFHYADYQELVATRESLKKLTAKEDDIKFKLMSHMGDAEVLIDFRGCKLATLKENKRGSRTFMLKQQIGE